MIFISFYKQLGGIVTPNDAKCHLKDVTSGTGKKYYDKTNDMVGESKRLYCRSCNHIEQIRD